MASQRNMQQEDTRLRVLRLIENHPKISTRKIANSVGISNGSAYYIVRALIEKGFLKIDNFKKSHNKIKYVYLLTPKGIIEKSQLTKSFIKRRKIEFLNLELEIQSLEEEYLYDLNP